MFEKKNPTFFLHSDFVYVDQKLWLKQMEILLHARTTVY